MRLLFLLLCSLPTLYAAAQDTATAVASQRYAHPSFTERTFIGANYRRSWAEPVGARVLHLRQEGFTVKGPGGGMQTSSLHLEDRSGGQWVLRSLDKTTERAMDATGIRDKRIRKLSQQMISAAMPYGPLTIVPMARAAGVMSTGPELVYVPDDPALGNYGNRFARTLCLLEQREPVHQRGDSVTGTRKMRRYLEQNTKYRLDAHQLLQARLLDMLVADWDRHDDQWKWGYHGERNGTVTIYPIPRDHDQAYFNPTGVLFGLMRTLHVHMFTGFRKGLRLRQLNYRSWYFDQTLLKDLNEADWREGIQAFRTELNDSVLSAGVRQLPAPVYRRYGADFLRVLKFRRDRLPVQGMKYYRFLQTHPKQVAKSGRKQQQLMEMAERVKEKAAAQDGQ